MQRGKEVETGKALDLKGCSSSSSRVLLPVILFSGCP